MVSPGSTNVIIVTGDATPYYATLERVKASSNAAASSISQTFTRVGSSMTSVGKTLTRNVTLPIVAIGAASVKLATDFEDAFTKIRANTNLTGAEIEKLKGFVLDLSGKTAKSPQELADALYFLASAGLSAQQVQETLAMSAKASASGFGEVSDIAKLTAQALNAYAKDGLTAAQVTDTLAAAIREGTAEPTEFASALGRILPFAQKAGIGFDEVTASLASLSNIGLNVNEGVTAMRGVLQALIAPTDAAREAMQKYGLSADELRTSLAEDGLLATLRLLETATKGNIDAQRDIIPNIRALSGLFGITGQKADKVTQSFENVTHASGDLNKAFEKTKQGPGFQFHQMLADLQKAGIELGERLLPVLIDVAHEVGDLAESFGNLPKPVQENIIKFGLLAAAAGPVLRILGAVTTGVGKLGGALSGAGGGGILGPGVLAAINLFTDSKINEKLKDMQAQAGMANDQFANLSRRFTLFAGGPLMGVTGGIDDFTQSMRGGHSVLESLTDALNPFNDGISTAKGVIDRTSDAHKQLTVRVLTLREALPKLGGSLSEATKFTIDHYIASGNLKGALELLEREVNQAGAKFENERKNIDDAAGATADHTQKVRALTAALKHVPEHVSADVSLPGIETAIAQGHALLGLLNSINSNVGAFVKFGGSAGDFPGRAVGGPVLPQRSYIVGERGPEILTMGRQGGFVTPNGGLGNLKLEVNLSGPVELVLADGTSFPAYIRQESARGLHADVRHWIGN